jgi:hypothetical protein
MCVREWLAGEAGSVRDLPFSEMQAREPPNSPLKRVQQSRSRSPTLLTPPPVNTH